MWHEGMVPSHSVSSRKCCSLLECCGTKLNTWLHHVTCRNGRASVWCISITFDESILCESHAVTYSVCYVTTWSKFMPRVMSLLYRSRKIWSRCSVLFETLAVITKWDVRMPIMCVAYNESLKIVSKEKL